MFRISVSRPLSLSAAISEFSKSSLSTAGDATSLCGEKQRGSAGACDGSRSKAHSPVSRCRAPCNSTYSVCRRRASAPSSRANSPSPRPSRPFLSVRPASAPGPRAEVENAAPFSNARGRRGNARSAGRGPRRAPVPRGARGSERN